MPFPSSPPFSLNNFLVEKITIFSKINQVSVRGSVSRLVDWKHNHRPVNLSAIWFNLATAALAVQDQGYLIIYTLILVHVASSMSVTKQYQDSISNNPAQSLTLIVRETRKKRFAKLKTFRSPTQRLKWCLYNEIYNDLDQVWVRRKDLSRTSHKKLNAIQCDAVFCKAHAPAAAFCFKFVYAK